MKRFFLLIMMGLLCFNSNSFAGDVKPVGPKGIKNDILLKSIPVLDNGRLKPFDTYSRHVLLQLSGKDTVNGQGATTWMAKLLFAPDSIRNDAVFLINNPEIPLALGIEADKHRRYSFNQLQKSFKKFKELADAAKDVSDKERSVTESETIRVYDNLQFFAQLSHTFQFVVPHPDFQIKDPQVIKILNLPETKGQYSFLDLALSADQMQVKMQEPEILILVNNLYEWSKRYRDLPFAVIPPPSGVDRMWLSPWDAIAMDFKSSQTREMVSLWRLMIKSYTDGNNVEFNLAAKRYLNVVSQRMSKDEVKSFHKFNIELAYQQAQPFLWAQILYIFVLLCFVISFMDRRKFWYQAAFFCAAIGFGIHALGLAARIIIMGRPPVSNLYETFIFVSLIASILGLTIEHFSRRWLGFVVIGIGGTVLLSIAAKYAADGDTLQMLIAVLNSNFWLSTHVTSITMGYGATCVAGILGHMWLVQKAMKVNEEDVKHTYQIMMGVLGIALTLTFLGTNLGGIWADQSWGRFWGWDPKENGALMIVLWSAFLFHCRVANLCGPLGLAVGNVFGVIVVVWAWFGVNLLSVGLHSYGFTTGIAVNLAMYLAIEIIFVATTVFLIKRR